MLLRKGIANNADPSSIYSIIDADKFFKDMEVCGGINPISSEKLSAVAAAHRVYTNSLAVLPFMIRQKDGAKRLEVDHPLNYVLKLRGNRMMPAYLVKKVIMSQAFWYGRGYGYIVRDSRGCPQEILPLPSAGCQRMVDQKSGSIWYSFSVPQDAPGYSMLQRKFQESELLIHNFETYDGYTGRGLLDIAKESIRSDLAAQKYNEKFYSNGARLSGIIEVDGELKPENRKRVREDFERMTAGMDNAFRVAVLDLSMKYTPLGINQKDSQYVESRGFAISEIARMTGIPEYMLQSGKQSYQSNEQQQLDFITNTLMAPVTQIEEEWAYKLFNRRELEAGLYLKLNTAALLRGDNKSRAFYYEKMIALGLENQDELRALEDQSPLPDGRGQHYWMSKNYDTIDNIISLGGRDSQPPNVDAEA